MPMPSEIVPAMVKFSAMVFGGVEPDRALQVLADAIGVSSVGICRKRSSDSAMKLIVQNKDGSLRPDAVEQIQNNSKNHMVELGASGEVRDFLVIQSRMARLLPEQIDMLTQSIAYLSGIWQARETKFEQSLIPSDDVPTSCILHPSNPYGLTRTELRVCDLIGVGQRPKTIAETLSASMPTVRTHLRNIYAKTGLDGMLGVLHNIQSGNSVQDKAA